MSSKTLFFFPVPYPDEILYSVLCRYHIRCGIPSARQTNLAVWGKIYGKKLFLPDGIENLTAQIPLSANFTTERFINENTIFPLLKPFLTREKSDALINSMRFGNKDIYNIIGFSRVFTLQHRFLRYCGQCVENDIKIYGEPYWHRIHQLPGTYVCSIHCEPIIESSVELDDLRNEYFPLIATLLVSEQSYKADITVRLLSFAQDAAWLLQHGYELNNSEHTAKLYDDWFRVKKYRDPHGKTSSKRLAQDIVDYYGHEFLTMFGAYDFGACVWLKRIIQHRQSFQHPLYHLLLMRFLAGSVNEFFTGIRESLPEYLPFGAPPYPCRNYACDYHLHDVIATIDIKKANGEPFANFICPHCGFTYRRNGNTPKEKQYTGQIHILDYGHKWEEVVAELLSAGISPYKIARDFHCDVRTILTFGVKHNLLPPERRMGRNPYVPMDLPQRKIAFDEQLDHYRQRWLTLRAKNPNATRNALRLIDPKCYEWLKKNDHEWFEMNAPTSKKAVPIWIDSDDDYLERVDNAIKQIRASPGRPKRVSIATIGKKAGITKPYTKLISNKLPKTKAFVAENVDTLEQWQKRKILWAVQQMRERGEILTVYKVRHAAYIEDKERKMDGFIFECIKNSE
jgi:hypothetical protein